MDAFGYLSLVVTSCFANIVVIGILASFIIMAFGTLLMPVRRDHGAGFLLDGIIMCGVLCGLSAAQLGAIPLSFNAVARAGLYTFPAGPAMEAYTAAIGWILKGVGIISSACMGLGGLMLVGSRGHSGWQPFIMGMTMEALGTLVGGGGIIRVILHVAGITVPVLV
nr:hypothetical protein [Candidatus Sigynarchaeota archaeon]